MPYTATRTAGARLSLDHVAPDGADQGVDELSHLVEHIGARDGPRGDFAVGALDPALHDLAAVLLDQLREAHP